MRLSLLLIAILISACGKNFEDLDGANAPQAVINKVLTRAEKALVDREIVPFIGSFLSTQEKLRLENDLKVGKSTYPSAWHLNEYTNSAEFNAKMGNRATALTYSYKIYFESRERITQLTQKPYVGVCWRGSKVIILNKDWWDDRKVAKDEVFQKILVFHELGHCYLKRPHKTNSIMEAILIYPSEYTPKKDFYDKELFGM
jgi:hypothetical protein